MKAIIIAAGMGNRLARLGKNCPKCLLEIDGLSLLERQLVNFRQAGIRDITVVTGHRAEQLQRIVGIRTVLNPQFRQNNVLASLMYATDELDDDVIISYSDIVYPQTTLDALADAHGDILLACDEHWRTSYVGRVDHPPQQAEKVATRDGLIIRIGKHISENEAAAEFIGVARLSRRAADTLRATFVEIAAIRAEQPFQAAPSIQRAYLTDMFQELLDRGHKLKPVMIQGPWFEIDTIEDFRRAGGTVSFDRRSGLNFRSILNDLKRRPEDAASELGVPLGDIEGVIAGTLPLPHALVEQATAIWPVSPRDFYLLDDDSPIGVRIFRAGESAVSARVMSRGGRPYYEYRDTAMSSVSQFRPEWIKELCVVCDADPHNEAVQWNNGHFLHQFTYFIGPVNFYYRTSDGTKQMAAMNTGDSVYITPFVPHSFATRENASGTMGLILALTFGNRLAGESRQELAALGPAVVPGLTLDLSRNSAAVASLLRFHRNAASLTRAELARRAPMSAIRLADIEDGVSRPGFDELRALASALRVNTRDLLPPETTEDAVAIQAHRTALRWTFPETDPAYEMVELAGVRSLPFSKGLEVNLLLDAVGEPNITTGLHQYVYNIGAVPVMFTWRFEDLVYHDVLAPADSIYVKPCIAHGFHGKGGQLLVLRIGGRLSGDSQFELSRIAASGEGNLDRVISESGQWYDPAGRRELSTRPSP